MRKTVLPIVAVGAIIVLILLVRVFLPTELWIIKSVYFYVVDEIVSVTGLNRQLSGGIVLLLLVPLIWVIPVLLKRRHKYNKLGWVAVLLYIAGFSVSMFFLGKDLYFKAKDGKVLKYYSVRQNGEIVIFDNPGYDPQTQAKLKPVTQEIVEQINLRKDGNPEKKDPETAIWFNPFTGKPQLWYCAVAANTFDFFDKPGYHPRTGKDLMPVSREFYATWQQLQVETKKAKKTSTHERVSVSKSVQSDKSVKKSAINDELW